MRFFIVVKAPMAMVSRIRYRGAMRQHRDHIGWHDPFRPECRIRSNPVGCRSSRSARLQGIKCAIEKKNMYLRFSCFTGDVMGMNMVSKGVQNNLTGSAMAGALGGFNAHVKI
ncbi:hypothetical protein GQ457_17G006090 [Hibiscus cannabinus]